MANLQACRASNELCEKLQVCGGLSEEGVAARAFSGRYARAVILGEPFEKKRVWAVLAAHRKKRNYPSANRQFNVAGIRHE